MLKDRIVFFNGEYVPWNQATLHVSSHSFARGSAIFEVLSLHQTDTGPAVFRLDEHLLRLFQSAKLLDMTLSISVEGLETAVRETIRRNRLKKGVIKIICFYPETAFDILPPETTAGAVILAVDPEQDLPKMVSPAGKGTTLCISRWRKLDPQTVPIEAKASANYLNGMMARLEAKKQGFEQAVMLDTQGFVAEGGTESVFWVKDGILKTPASGTILQSITRKSILEAAPADGISVAEIRQGPEALLEADEIFLSCTPFKTLCVKQINNRFFEKIPGPVSLKVIDLLEGIVSGRDSRYQHWLFPA
ncbi:MAG: aminotransferase class IV [Thermodesulfobacteriota bacterium]